MAIVVKNHQLIFTLPGTKTIIMAEDQITNVKLSFTCSENWDAMAPTHNGRHCDKCNKTVYDFTNTKVEDFRAIMAENNHNICGRFRLEQVAPVNILRWKKWASAALVVIGLGFLSKKADAQTNNNTAKDSTSAAQMQRMEVFGGVNEVMPEFPGGYERFKAFVAKNLDRTKAEKPGRINVTFVVETNGSLSDIKAIGRYSGQNGIKEAIRVMKLSPKWIPGKRSGKPVKVQYTVPIIFE